MVNYLVLLTVTLGRCPVPEEKYIAPRGYVCYRAGTSIMVDGRPDEPAWQAAPWSDNFVDIEGDLKPRPRFRTRVKMLWDDDYFYIAAELDEPHVWGTLNVRDSVIFHDNDFEVFIDPDGDNHNYGEFEINALNTGWDLRLTKPYKDGGKADDGWEIPGIKTAVHVDGTLNDSRDTDRGWTIEIAIPWQFAATLSDLSAPIRPARRRGAVFEGFEDGHAVERAAEPPRTRGGFVSAPPREGDQWRLNFSRVEWQHRITSNGKYEKIPNTREDNWVWSPQRVMNMHRPETWGYVQFSTAAPPNRTAGKTESVSVRSDHAGAAKHLLHRVYYAQHEFRKQHDRFAQSIDELGIANLSHERLAAPLALETDGRRFKVTAELRLPADRSERWHIREDSRIWKD